MATNPVELAYQPGQIVYFIRASLQITSPFTVYNTSTQLYETYSAANWANYITQMTEVAPGLYRAVAPAGSLSVPATEYFYTVRASGGTLTNADPTGDAPIIGTGNSQGVQIGTINGRTSTVSPNPSADVDIANLALIHLSQRSITSFSDDSPQARALNLIYANTRDEVLRGASWKFATIIAALVNLPNEAVTGWGYVFEMPDDAVLIRKVFYDNSGFYNYPVFWNSYYWEDQPPLITNPIPTEFRVIYQKDINAQVIVSNLQTPFIEYTARIDDPTVYDALFIEALTYKLASKLALILNSNKELAEKYQQEFMMKMSEAARVNANEDQIPNREKSTYFDVR